MYGALPRCPDCGGGILRVRYPSKWGHQGQGNFSCPGYYDDDTFRRCPFASTDVERPAWQDADKAGTPPAKSAPPAAPAASHSAKKPKVASAPPAPPAAAPKVAMPGDDD
jgi:hypothetical protein